MLRRKWTLQTNPCAGRGGNPQTPRPSAAVRPCHAPPWRGLDPPRLTEKETEARRPRTCPRSGTTSERRGGSSNLGSGARRARRAAQGGGGRITWGCCCGRAWLCSGLASVLRPRRLRSGQGWSRRSAPPAPRASHPLPRLRPHLAAPGFRARLARRPSPSLSPARPGLSLLPPLQARAHTRILSVFASLPLLGLSPTLSPAFSFPSRRQPFLLSALTLPPFSSSLSRCPLFLSFVPLAPAHSPRSLAGVPESSCSVTGWVEGALALASAHRWRAGWPGRARPRSGGTPHPGCPALSHLESGWKTKNWFPGKSLDNSGIRGT